MSEVQFKFELNPESPLNNYSSYANKLRGLFRSWNGILEEYEEAWRKDKNLPYIYNEQAEIVLLALAARETSGFPFVEFSIQKHNKGDDYAGRVDLEISWKRLDWYLGVEAKRAKISCSSRRHDKDLVNTIKTPLKEASACANGLNKYYHDRLALVIGPLVLADDSFDGRKFSDVLVNAAWEVKADFCVIHICDVDTWMNSDSPRCPGIVLVGKMYGKRGRRFRE